MCGIAGIYDFGRRPVEVAEIEAMNDAIAHRGPDDQGTWTGDGVALANRRLAIIDLSAAGHQPMANEDGSLLIVYNGELYNFRELMAELEGRGHRFRSHTDTEVVLHAVEEWGPAALDRFDGMFAFAVLDTRTRKLFLARDRFGIKPLYYAVDGDRLLFASEIKALLAAGLPRRVSSAALVEYFTFQNVYSDLTLFDGVHMLPAGFTLTADDAGVRTQRYWDLAFEPDEDVSEAEWEERIAEAFTDAVRRQLVSDVPVGSYLSGGMDSGSIVSVASRHVPRLMTFTGGFDMSSVTGLELVFDERREAEAIASAFRTQHYEMVLHAGDMAWVLPELTWHLEDLRVGMSYQNYYIAGLASKFVKVSLAGTGGDELFAGYPWRYDLIADIPDRDAFDTAYYAYWARLVNDADRPLFFEHDVLAAAGDHSPFEVYRETIAPADGLDPISRALYFETKTFLHGLLVVEDKVSMAHGLEARVPFLDNALVDLASRIPSRVKHANGAGKAVLRRAMAGILPGGAVERAKQGFSPPDRSWYSGPTMDYIRDILLDPRARERGYFRPDYVNRVLDEHSAGRVNHRLLIWSLLSFEWWNRVFIDGDEPAR